MYGTRVGTTIVPSSAFRIGIIEPRLYGDLFADNVRRWVDVHKACQLGVGTSKDCTSRGATFNVFANGPVVEWSDTSDTIVNNTIGEVGKGAILEAATLPYLAHPEVAKRPTLMMFSVTGHVMVAIYFSTGRGGEFHILNPWPLGNQQQLKDVYTAVDVNLKDDARNVRIVDVAGEVQKATGKNINLQEGEKVGFCTLWVGILADAVLTAPRPDKVPPMTFLQTQMKKSTSTGTLPPLVLEFYTDVYSRLLIEKDKLIAEAKKVFPDKCAEAASAIAVGKLASQAATVTEPLTAAPTEPGSGGKRTVGRRTRKRVSTWKRRDQRLSRARRTRRVVKRRGRSTLHSCS